MVEITRRKRKPLSERSEREDEMEEEDLCSDNVITPLLVCDVRSGGRSFSIRILRSRKEFLI